MFAATFSVTSFSSCEQLILSLCMSKLLPSFYVGRFFAALSIILKCIERNRNCFLFEIKSIVGLECDDINCCELSIPFSCRSKLRSKLGEVPRA